jgi:hypothetical protein
MIFGCGARCRFREPILIFAKLQPRRALSLRSSSPGWL